MEPVINEKKLVNDESYNGSRIIGIFILAFFLERFCWISLGVITTSIRKFLNLPLFWMKYLELLILQL